MMWSLLALGFVIGFCFCLFSVFLGVAVGNIISAASKVEGSITPVRIEGDL
jgi:hypothetical protein